MKQKYTLPILTLGHFIVDLACLYFYFANFPQCGMISIINNALLYNFLAFALQAPIGFLFDKFPANHSTATGILFVLGGYLLGLWHFSAAGLLLCGLGNAFYHVGGSIGIGRTDKKGLRDSGIFVSTGALGVSLGTYLAAHSKELSDFFAHFTTSVMFPLLIVLFILQILVVSPGRQTPASFSPKTNAAFLLLSLSAIFIRSLGGLFFPPHYKEVLVFSNNIPLNIFLVAMSSGIAAFFGKFSGGFLSILCTNLLHRFAPAKTVDLRTGNYIFGIITLLFSCLLLTLAGHIPALCFLGILCFHAAMPVTLFELYCILPDRPGFAMGLSTVMLFLGYLPYAFAPLTDLPASLILCILTLLAIVCMLASLLLYLRSSHTREEKTNGGMP